MRKKVNDTEITDFIHRRKDGHQTEKCTKYYIPRSTYYKSLDKTVSNHERENNE